MGARARGSPAIDNVILFDRRSAVGAMDCVQRLRHNKYTCAIDFQGLYKSSVISMLSGAPRRIGFDRDGRAKAEQRCFIPSESLRGQSRRRIKLFLGAGGRSVAPGMPGVSASRSGRRRRFCPGAIG